jgi:hemerythrin-like metal-binding protein
MPLIEWNDVYSVGIDIIDEQHRKFFSLINALFDAMKEGKGDELVQAVLKELQDYVIYHFQSEESWMKMCNYPYFDKHKHEHQEAIKKVNKLIIEHERGNQDVTIEMLKFLSAWLQDHILKTDREYIPFLKEII